MLKFIIVTVSTGIVVLMNCLAAQVVQAVSFIIGLNWSMETAYIVVTIALLALRMWARTTVTRYGFKIE